MKGHTGVRTFECIQYVTGPLDGTLEDWPAQIQDAAHAAMERKSQEEQIPLTVVAAYCDKDHDAIDPRKTWFVRIILSEIVVAPAPEARLQ